jgi:hypothetical protein
MLYYDAATIEGFWMRTFAPAKARPANLTRLPATVFRTISGFSSEARRRSPGAVPDSVKETLADSGRPLEPGLMKEMSNRLRFDFSNVRIHSDERAHTSAVEIGALAYTAGPHIAFQRNAFQPSTARGRRVLVHELAHVRQQPRLAPGELTLGDPQAAEEKSAGEVASIAYAGDGVRSQPAIPDAAPERSVPPVVRRLVVDEPDPHTQSRARVPALSRASRALIPRMRAVSLKLGAGPPASMSVAFRAINQVWDAVIYALAHMESLNLSKQAQKRLRKVVVSFIDQVELNVDSLVKEPRKVDYSDFYIGLLSLFYAMFDPKLEFERKLQKAVEDAPEAPVHDWYA